MLYPEINRNYCHWGLWNIPLQAQARNHGITRKQNFLQPLMTIFWFANMGGACISMGNTWLKQNFRNSSGNFAFRGVSEL
jgi:phosphatidylethanolamine-binding protein (PEBP) family uncharacterized protein